MEYFLDYSFKNKEYEKMRIKFRDYENEDIRLLKEYVIAYDKLMYKRYKNKNKQNHDKKN